MADIYTGNLVGMSKIATGTESAFCRALLGGKLSLQSRDIEKPGAGGQWHTIKGVLEGTLDFECVGVAKADLQLFFPTTLGTQMLAFPDFCCKCDDGSNGLDFLCEFCQPASLTIECGDGEDAEVTVSGSIKVATVTPAAAGTYEPVYYDAATQGGHRSGDCTVTYGGSYNGVHGTLSWSIKSDLGTKMVNLQDGKEVGHKMLPSGYIITAIRTTAQTTTTEPFMMQSLPLTDAHDSGDISIALANGTSAQNVTFTLESFKCNNVELDLGPEDLKAFAHDWSPAAGTTYARCTIA